MVQGLIDLNSITIFNYNKKLRYERLQKRKNEFERCEQLVD
jgi:hypothetical protein